MIKWRQSQNRDNRHIAELGPARLVVEQREGHDSIWFAWSVPALIADEAMKATDLDAAKAEAVALLLSQCAAIARACE